MAIHGFFGEYRYLSNFHMKNFVLDTITFNCSEQAYMYQKTMVPSELSRILGCKTGPESKKIGRTATLRDDWDLYRLYAMQRVLVAKFRDPELAEKLIDTRDLYLEETNTWQDRFWGVCGGLGHNHLGKTLMKIRTRLIESRNPFENL